MMFGLIALDKIRVYLECNPKYNAYNLHFINAGECMTLQGLI